MFVMGNKVNLFVQYFFCYYDDLVEEVLFVIVVNGMVLLVMMVLLFDFDDFIIGYFFIEGIVKLVVEIKDIQIEFMFFGFEV